MQKQDKLSQTAKLATFSNGPHFMTQDHLFTNEMSVVARPCLPTVNNGWHSGSRSIYKRCHLAKNVYTVLTTLSPECVVFSSGFVVCLFFFCLKNKHKMVHELVCL